MELSDYQKQAYVAIQGHANAKEEEMHWALGLGEEAGEVLGVIKHRHYGAEFSVTDVVAELGDVMWHVAAICTVFGISMDDVAQYNILKLNNRYPEGKFDMGRSARRHEIGKRFKGLPETKALMEKINNDYLRKAEERK